MARTPPSPARKIELAEATRAAFEAPGSPTTFGDLAERLGVAADKHLALVLDRREVKPDVIHLRLSGRRDKPIRAEAPVFSRDALERGEELDRVLQFVLRHVQTPATRAFTVAQLVAAVRGGGKSSGGSALKAALARALQTRTLPPGFGAISIRGSAYIFRLQDLVTGAARSLAPRPRGSDEGAPVETTPGRPEGEPPPAGTSDFAAAFDAAFSRLDAMGRSLNLVKLSALRDALPQYERSAFDAGLRALRIEGRYELNAAEGTHRRLTDSEREAGIVEAGTRLVYCQRVR
jgi:ribosomal protein S9